MIVENIVVDLHVDGILIQSMLLSIQVNCLFVIINFDKDLRET